MSTQSNRRTAARFLSGLKVTAHHLELDHECEAINLSRTGALISGELPDTLGKTLVVTIESSAGDIRVRFECQVTHHEHEDHGGSLVGLRFREPGLDERKQLEALIARVIECSSSAALSRLSTESSPEEIEHALQTMPIAHRMLEAGRAQIKERAFLMQDSNPQVLEALARNQQLTAAEASALARNPLLVPSTLDILARAQRFSNNEELRFLLATHPRAGFELIKQLVATMKPPVVRRVLANSSLDQSLKRKLLGS